MKPGIMCLIILVLTACKSELSVPANILPIKKMQSILWDMMRADALVTYKASRDSTINKQDSSLYFYRQVFKIHDINKEQFKQSLHYYQAHPVLLPPVLDSLYAKSSIPGEIYSHPMPKK